MRSTWKERLILRLYPKRLRRLAGDELIQWWRDWNASHADQPRLLRAARIAWRLAKDVSSAHAERLTNPTILRAVDETPRSRRVLHWIASQPTELRLAARSARRHAPATVLGAITLGLGVAAVAVVLSVVDTVVLRPLPYPDADRLVRVGNTSDEPGKDDVLYALSAPDFRDLEDRNQSFDALGASRLGRFTVRVPAADRSGEVDSRDASPRDSIPESLLGAYVSAGFFDAIGVHPRQGRPINRDEDRTGSPVVILSAELAARSFGNQEALGQVLEIDQIPFEIIGVMPMGFEPPEGIFQGGATFWLPFGRFPEEVRRNRSDTFLAAIGRLRAESSLDTARAELATLGRLLSTEYPDADHRVFGASSLKTQTIGDFDDTLWTMLGAVALLMLVAGANLASLQIAAGIDRRREFAVRRSLGADRSQILSQVLNENLILGAGAALIGGLVAWAALRLVRAGIAVEVPRINELEPTANLVWLAATLGIGGALLFGLLPNAVTARLRPGRLADALRSGARGDVGGLGQERTRSGLVIAETALAVVLVIGAGLLLSSYTKLAQVDLGFDPLGVEGAVLIAPQDDDDAKRAYYREVLEGTRALPGTQSVGLASITPLGGGRQMQGLSFERAELARDLQRDQPYPVHYQVATTGFLEALSIPVLSGRSFGPVDEHPDRRTVLINQVIADELAALGVEPIGQRFLLGEHGLRQEPFEIVGVVGATQQNRLSDPRMRRIYFHFDQVPRSLMRLFVKTTGDASVLPEVRSLVAELRPEQPALATFRLEDVVGRSLGEPRFYVQLIGALAMTAAFLALVGVYSTLRFLVVRRRREVGLRMALGASHRAILRLVIGRGLLLVSIGLALGLASALGVMRVLESFLFQVAPRDPSTYLSVTIFVLFAGLAASYWPARAAARTPPASVLGEGD